MSGAGVPEQRRVDPFVTEFRLYDATGRLAEIEVTVNGPPVARGPGRWGLPCSLSKPVSANELAGRKLVLGDAFKVVSHAAGVSFEMVLETRRNGSTVPPLRQNFTLVRSNGAEGEPIFWDRRVAVVPRGADPADVTEIERYETALPASWISVDDNRPSQVHAIGVSAADTQSYVPDSRASVEAAPRPGNESQVAGREVVARYRDRPTLGISDLGAIDEVTADRAVDDALLVSFVPSDFLPAGVSVGSRVRLERCIEGAVLPRIAVDDTGAALMARDGTPQPWPLSAADLAALQQQDAARDISNWFLAHAAARLADIDEAFERIGEVDPTRPLRDSVPNRPSRWLYRVRAIDRAGHLSRAGQVLQCVVRVPTPMRGVLPELLSLRIEAGTATVRLRDRSNGADALFLVTSADPRLAVARAEVSTVRNRPDLDVDARLLIRDDKGRKLPMSAVAPGGAEPDIVEQSFPVPDNHRFHVWALSVGADGVPSRLIGPIHAARGLPPEVT